MARVPRWMQAQVRSYEDATQRVYNKSNPASEEAAVVRYWTKIRPVARILASARDESNRLDDGREVKYSRAGLLFFYVVALVLNKHITESYSFVKSSPRLRKLLHDQFGWAEPTKETLAQLAAARNCDEVPEENFPSRQTVMYLFEWIDRWDGEDLVDPKTGEIARVVSLEALESYAYTRVPVEIARRFDLDLSRAAVDSTLIKSPRQRNTKRGKRPDDGAGWLGREGEKATFGRRKVSTVATDLPVIIDSAITTDAEVTDVRGRAIAALRARSEEMKDLAKRRRMTTFRGLDEALLVGDNAFGTNEIMRQIHLHGFRGAFRLRNSLRREVIGTRQVSHARAGQDLKLILDVCNDGVHFCPCDTGHHPHERTPMLQTAGRTGIDGHVYVQCERDTCPHYGIKFYVPYRKPDTVLANDTRRLGEPDYSLVAPDSRALKDVEIAIFKGCQAIEHYHSMLLAKHGLGIKDTRGRRKFSGNLRHRFYYALGDLIWNLTILFNLQDGFAHKEIEREALWQALLRNRRDLDAIDEAKAKSESTETTANDASPGKPKKKRKKKTPTYARYRWRYETVTTTPSN